MGTPLLLGETCDPFISSPADRVIILTFTFSLLMVSTLAEAVDKALETRNFNNVYELIEVLLLQPEIDASSIMSQAGLLSSPREAIQ